MQYTDLSFIPGIGYTDIKSYPPSPNGINTVSPTTKGPYLKHPHAIFIKTDNFT